MIKNESDYANFQSNKIYTLCGVNLEYILE